jgi:hypothetical protein
MILENSLSALRIHIHLALLISWRTEEVKMCIRIRRGRDHICLSVQRRAAARIVLYRWPVIEKPCFQKLSENQ